MLSLLVRKCSNASYYIYLSIYLVIDVELDLTSLGFGTYY